MMNSYIYGIIFLILNFGALGLGSWLMNNGPTTAWYINLNKAPWTPPGWVFGVAWSLIMLCFSIYITKLIKLDNSLVVWLLFGIQFVLNVSWNYVFFNKHHIVFGLFIIISLAFVVIALLWKNHPTMQQFSWFLVPYVIWLLIAISLNAYVALKN